MTRLEKLLAQSVAIQHVLWAADRGFEPIEVIHSVGATWRPKYTVPTWEDAVEVLSKRWLRLMHPTPELRLVA